jgi:hypothetical protein
MKRPPITAAILVLLQTAALWPAGDGAVLAQSSMPAAAPEETPAAAPSAEPAAESATPSPDDPTLTAGGALAAFMSSRHYGTIRQLKSLMTPALQARFDHDSAPFNGKRTIRLSAFEFSEKDLRPAGPRGGRPAGQSAPGASIPEAYVATVRGLWEDQGEAVELRTESVRIARNDQGLWRIAALDRASSDALRFRDAVPGVTVLRLVLRAWARRDAKTARGYMSPAFLKRYAGRDEALEGLLAGREDPRHIAFQIVEMAAKGENEAVARVRLFETSPGRPYSLEGSVHTLRMVRKGAPWLLDAWD